MLFKRVHWANIRRGLTWVGVSGHVVPGVKRVQGGVGGADDVDELVVVGLGPGRLAGTLDILVVPLSRQQRLSSADNHVHETLAGEVGVGRRQGHRHRSGHKYRKDEVMIGLRRGKKS